MEANVVPTISLSPGSYLYPASGFYTGMDGATDITLTGLVIGSMTIEVDRYEEDVFAETLNEMTFSGSGVVATGIHGRDGDTRVAIFPESTGLKVRVTVTSGGLSTVVMTTAP